MRQGKAFEIPKRLVWQSYTQVRSNRGSPGIDGQTVAQFDEHRDRNLYKIWNRLSSGTYFPPPVRAKSIPKEDGTDRVLGIPTVSDRIAQGAVKLVVEEILEPVFHSDSYGYRPGRSAHQAIQKCQERCWKNGWVLEVDISAFFDTVRHDLIIKALDFHNVPRWVSLYCTRWLRAPSLDGSKGTESSPRQRGTPQGGVISPLLANLFLHYAFDMWMLRTFGHVKFERYADDIVCHCRSWRETLALKVAIAKRMQEVGLKVNDEKSKVVYIDTFRRWNVGTSFTFLGYDFQLRTVRNSKGELFRKCMPGASKKAMRRITKTIRDWRIHRSTKEDIRIFAKRHNTMLRGWIEYYGKFWYWNFSYRLWTVFQSRLLKWAKGKFRISSRQAERKLALIRRENPKLFAHWCLLREQNV